MAKAALTFSQSIPVCGMFPDNLILSIFNTYYTITHLATDLIRGMRGLYTFLHDIPGTNTLDSLTPAYLHAMSLLILCFPSYINYVKVSY